MTRRLTVAAAALLALPVVAVWTPDASAFTTAKRLCVNSALNASSTNGAREPIEPTRSRDLLILRGNRRRPRRDTTRPYQARPHAARVSLVEAAFVMDRRLDAHGLPRPPHLYGLLILDGERRRLLLFTREEGAGCVVPGRVSLGDHSFSKLHRQRPARDDRWPLPMVAESEDHRKQARLPPGPRSTATATNGRCPISRAASVMTA